MRRLLTMILLAIGTALPASVPTGSISEFLAAEMPRASVPGLAYAIVSDGEIKEQEAFGTQSSGSDVEVTPQQPFAAGSITKSITALAVMQLVETGQLALDAPISKYLSDFQDTLGAPVTLRMLLSHTSGFSTLQGNQSHEDVAAGDDELARIVASYAAEPPAYLPGSHWEYSNRNYQILGRLIDVTSGQDFQSYVQQRILTPAGMADSFVADGAIHPEMVTGNRPWFGGRRPIEEHRTDRGTAPQGGVIASAPDLARYMVLMMNGQDDILSAAGKAQMMLPASDASPHYGFGWFIDPAQGTVGHSGSTPGFETLLTMVPAQKRGVVVLANANSGIGFGETAELRNGVTARALGLDYNGEASRWSQKLLFVMVTLAPIAYLCSIGWAWRHRSAIRAKRASGIAGQFSLWFPLVTTLAAAAVIFLLIPQLFGVSIATLNQFQPDLGLAMISTAVLGLVWSVFRLGVAYLAKEFAA